MCIRREGEFYLMLGELVENSIYSRRSRGRVDGEKYLEGNRRKHDIL